MEKKTDLRIQRTYRLLHIAFTKLMEARSFENITVNDLCEEAMIRRTTFYKHFADKYEYLSFYMTEIRDEFQNQLPPDISPSNAGAYFQSMSRALLLFLQQHQALVTNAAKSKLLPVMFDILGEQIRIDMQEAFRTDESLKPAVRENREILSAFYAGGLMSTLRLWLDRNMPDVDADMLNTLSALVMMGIRDC